MAREDIKKQVQDIFRDILDEEDLILTDITTAHDVDGWDSLSHIQLVVAMEKYFKLRFTAKEILSWNDVGELIDSIASKSS